MISCSDQRYYNFWYGRFNTPDPLGSKAADPSNPISWNMYAYVAGDPVNRGDPTGTFDDFLPMAPADWGGGGGGGGFCGPDWFMDASLSGPCGNPCGSSLLPNPACGYQGPAPPPPVQPAPDPQPTPDCSVSLWIRPVSGVPGFNHTYLEVVDASGDFTVEGGPTGPGPTGYLFGTVALAGSANAIGATNPGGPGNTEIGPAYTGSNACTDAQSIVTATENYNASGKWVMYNPVAGLSLPKIGFFSIVTFFGYNSNSFASTLVNQVGLTKYFGFSGNFLTPGWGRMVPGL